MEVFFFRSRKPDWGARGLRKKGLGFWNNDVFRLREKKDSTRRIEMGGGGAERSGVAKEDDESPGEEEYEGEIEEGRII